MISVYAPQVGRSDEEKEEFWRALDLAVKGVSPNERVLIAGDFNGHVGERTEGYEGVHGGRGLGERNEEGERLLEFADSTGMAVVNTFFEKPATRKVTYSSGGAVSQIDYMLVAREELKRVKNVAAIASEECVRQHRLLVMDWELPRAETRKEIPVERVRVWRLRDKGIREDFEEEVRKRTGLGPEPGASLEETWCAFRDTLMDAARSVCGMSKGSRRDRKTWLWSDEVKTKIRKKRECYLKWMRSGLETDRVVYVEARREAKKGVTCAQEKGRMELVKKLEEKGASARLFGMAKNMSRQRVDVGGMRTIRDGDRVVSKEEDVLETWTRHMKKVLNDDQGTKPRVETANAIEGPEKEIEAEEVKKALGSMRVGKAAGGSGLTVELLRAAGDTGLKWLTEIYNRVWREGKAPEDWKKGIVIPVYKGKGDPLDCGSYRPIKLLEHSMKVMERVIERRLREIVQVDEMQRGFMPGRSTVDAVFAIRSLVEKHLEKSERLWAAFVDLEKAFDRVPRELVWWSLRRKNVTESLIGAMKALYEGSRAAVRVKAGPKAQTGREFEVAVGVHQGSVLSPLLFVVVMDELTRQTRTGIPWELLFADDLALLAKTREALSLRLKSWKSALEAGGMKVNTAKTKVLEFGRGLQSKIESGRYPCRVCGKGVGANSILCISMRQVDARKMQRNTW